MLSQRIRKCYYKTLGTSMIQSPMSPPSLGRLAQFLWFKLCPYTGAIYYIHWDFVDTETESEWEREREKERESYLLYILIFLKKEILIYEGFCRNLKMSTNKLIKELHIGTGTVLWLC